MIASGRMKDYHDYLQNKFEEAKQEGLDELVLTARDVYRIVSKNPTLPTCCMAMKRMMRQGDEILIQPTTASGFGVSLTIRYWLADRDQREMCNPPQKPGAKKGSHRGGRRKLRKPIDLLMCETLEREGTTYQQTGRVIEANIKKGTWIIVCEAHKESFSAFLMELLTKVDGKTVKYTLLTEKKGYIRMWRKLPESWRKQNHIHMLYRGEREELKDVI